MNFHILSLFPEMVLQGLSTSITGRAAKQGKIHIDAVNIRDFSEDKHRRVDDYPYGGGAGMLMQAQPVYDAWQQVTKPLFSQEKRKVRTIYVTPQGEPFTQKKAEEFAAADDLVILCGHYEGIDERVLEEVVTDYVSIGDYVLTGGELAAMVIVDAVARLVPGVLHNDASAETESFHGNLLEHPQYSRPEVWHEKRVPEVLLSGNQKEVDKWRLEQSVLRTKERRPDLYESYRQMQECKELLMTQKLLHIDMIEAINRGAAQLVYRKGKEILLYHTQAGIFYHTDPEEKEEPYLYEWGEGLCERELSGANTLAQGALPSGAMVSEAMPDCLVLHQERYIAKAEQLFSLKHTMTCSHAVYTKKEKAPVSGLYRPDGKPMGNGLTIQPLHAEHADFVKENYRKMSPEYLAGRIEKGAMFGAFLGEQLAGFAGIHDDGGIGMLFVHPQYRRQKIAQALETYLVNLLLERGMTPYGQIETDNDASLQLQEKLGLYVAKSPVFWLEK
jgi:tRNA (guanine37-N1)-methyltransferase